MSIWAPFYFLKCWLRFSHKWRIFGGNLRRAGALIHLHPLAGAIAICTRCGQTWEDYGACFEPAEAEYKAERIKMMEEYGKEHGLWMR